MGLAKINGAAGMVLRGVIALFTVPFELKGTKSDLAMFKTETRVALGELTHEVRIHAKLEQEHNGELCRRVAVIDGKLEGLIVGLGLKDNPTERLR